jgi:hypothetical protein
MVTRNNKTSGFTIAAVSTIAVVAGLTVGVPVLDLIKEKTCASQVPPPAQAGSIEGILNALGLSTRETQSK